MKNDTKQAEVKSTPSKSTKKINDDKNYAECIVIKPVGYPFDFTLTDDDIEISNPKLFEEYAREQWLGLGVFKDSYLFDQKIIPDYAFQIIECIPDDSIISEKTTIKLLSEETVKNEKKTPFSDVRLTDIVGQKEAKNKVKIIEKFIKNPEKFGNWAPKNILFYGVPGTGKTMLVKALANELDATLYLVKATSLIGEHVGDASSKIHELFQKASKTTPSIIFIDEIDAIALHRSFQSLRGDVSEIVNSLLTEMDGITEHESVITIGATNNLNSIDLAIRSRFETEIEFKLPDEKERREIIEKNIKTLPVECDFNIDKLVNNTKNLSGRDIKEKILKTSLHNAIANDRDIITEKDIEYSLENSKIKIDEVKGMFE